MDGKGDDAAARKSSPKGSDSTLDASIAALVQRREQQKKKYEEERRQREEKRKNLLEQHRMQQEQMERQLQLIAEESRNLEKCSEHKAERYAQQNQDDEGDEARENNSPVHQLPHRGPVFDQIPQQEPNEEAKKDSTSSWFSLNNLVGIISAFFLGSAATLLLNKRTN